MTTSSRPKILCSACLEHCKCRYDGSVIENTTIKRLMHHVDFVTVCPEMGIGLPSPREAVRMVKIEDQKRLVDSYSGTDRTDEMNAFIDAFFKSQDLTSFDGVILKCKSPTCGVKDVKLYGGPGKRPALPETTSGIFGESVKNEMLQVPVEDDGRLKHFNIREHFFMSVFLRHRFRTVSTTCLSMSSLGPLVAFHSQNKYLMMAYNQALLKTLGKIVANHQKMSVESVLALYGESLAGLYQTQPSVGKNVNMLLHLFGYFKHDLSSPEKAYFLDQITLYQNKKVPFSSVLSIIKAWVVRFDESYLKEQTLFNLFPLDLIELTDSGKGL